ncbi:hypothetical protein ET445_02790 [Agromyces protaetiae]|uniref:Uncharacterized protein n=1 Tax=Agromyces protaetiae TaxID=2509455 RepID=A0A4P6FA27_9MICO|nr:hypothetical protein [Agromyces protaetiae]QAY72426.1 hypothetical protein ET445_02790 [Agromyces protaetiae]
MPAVFASGLLTASVVVTPGFPSEGSTTSGGALPDVEASATLVAVPWSLVALLVLAGIVWAAIVLGRKRRARREEAMIEAAVAAALEAREEEPTPVA